MSGDQAGIAPPPTADSTARVGLYRLLARLLARPPEASVLALLVGLRSEPGGHRALAGAWETLSQAAAGAGAEALEEEFHRLFIGLGRGELLPYASWYLAGRLLDRPLVEIRDDLARLGLARGEEVAEPEDHICALCEVMAVLVERGDEPAQQEFFRRHLAPWAGRFFADLRQARSSDFYRPVGALGEGFMALEADLLEIRG